MREKRVRRYESINWSRREKRKRRNELEFKSILGSGNEEEIEEDYEDLGLEEEE